MTNTINRYGDSPPDNDHEWKQARTNPLPHLVEAVLEGIPPLCVESPTEWVKTHYIDNDQRWWCAIADPEEEVVFHFHFWDGDKEWRFMGTEFKGGREYADNDVWMCAFASVVEQARRAGVMRGHKGEMIGEP